MFKNSKFKIISIVTLLLIVSTVAQASDFNKRQNTYTVNHKFYDEAGKRDYDYNWEVSISPAKGGNLNQPRPNMEKPNYGEKPSQPSRPIKPSLPNEESKPELPKEEGRPSLPNENNKPDLPKEEEVPNKPSTPNNNTNLSQIELEVVRLVNIERQKQGLSQFKTSSELSNVARIKSEDMYRNNYFSHNSPRYGSPFDMMKSFGIKYSTAGENIAKGYNTAQSVVNGWMNSSGHRANILNPSFNTIGVGAYTDSSGTIYWTQMFTN